MEKVHRLISMFCTGNLKKSKDSQIELDPTKKKCTVFFFNIKITQVPFPAKSNNLWSQVTPQLQPGELVDKFLLGARTTASDARVAPWMLETKQVSITKVQRKDL